MDFGTPLSFILYAFGALQTKLRNGTHLCTAMDKTLGSGSQATVSMEVASS